MKKILKNYAACIAIGAISILAAIFFAPIWNWWESCPWKNWGTQIISILVAVLIVLYLAFYLFKKIKNSHRQVIRVLTIVEFTLLSLIALGCVFTQFDLIKVQQASQIFALALWTRGTVELFRAYYYRSDSSENYPVWYLAISIAMVTFGTFFFAKPLIEDIVVLWIFVGLLFVGGLLLLALGINSANKQPKTIKKSVTKTPSKKENKKEEKVEVKPVVKKETPKKQEPKKTTTKKTTNTAKKPAVKKETTSSKTSK